MRAVIHGNASTTTYPLAGFYSVDDFAPFGTKSTSSASSYLSLASTGPTISLRDGFTGQEDQGPDFGVGYSDFGARQYSPILSRWLVPDPMGEKYYDVSPYAYCAGNPVNLVDPNGQFPAWLLGMGLDYGTQVYENYQNGKSGWDAWLNDINLVRLGLSAVTPGKKAKVAITLLTEATKASVSFTINDNVTINTDMKDVAEKTIVGTATDLVVGSVIQKGSSESVSEAGKKANTTAAQAEKAARKANAHPNSPKAAQEADKTAGAAQRSREQQVLSEMIHSVVGDSGEGIEKVINQIILFFHEDEKQKR